MKFAFLISLIVVLSSCAQLKIKNACKSKNWAEHSRNLALQGLPLKADLMINKCQSYDIELSQVLLETNYNEGLKVYCSETGVLKTGESGRLLNYDLCHFKDIEKIKNIHLQAVKKYCQPTQAYNVGLLGKSYNNVCPQNLLKNFIKEFDRGRRDYLLDEIKKIQRQVDDLDIVLSRVRQQQLYITNQLLMYPYNYSPSWYQNRLSSPTSYYQTQHYKDTLRHNLFSLENDMHIIMLRKRKLKIKIEKFNDEIKKANGLPEKAI